MTDIAIFEHMNVTFKNVLSKRLESGSMETMEKSFRMFDSYVKREGLEVHGPWIMKTSSLIVNNMNTIRTEMMIQLKGPMSNVTDPYTFMETLRLEGYLMARYKGPPNMVQMANMKLNVYAFEKEIDLGPETYSVYTSDEKGTVIDVFQQVLRW